MLLSAVPIDGLAPLDAKISADTAMAKFGSHLYAGFDGLTSIVQIKYAYCELPSSDL